MGSRRPNQLRLPAGGRRHDLSAQQHSANVVQPLPTDVAAGGLERLDSNPSTSSSGAVALTTGGQAGFKGAIFGGATIASQVIKLPGSPWDGEKATIMTGRPSPR
jgi:hypothetical protein